MTITEILPTHGPARTDRMTNDPTTNDTTMTRETTTNRTATLPGPAAATAVPRTTLVDIAIPVYNEEIDLGPSVERLVGYLRNEFPYPFRVTIADNASTDGTWALAQGLAEAYAEVRAVHLDAKGRGRALKQVWLASDAAVCAYMDVDLSTDLRAVLPLVAPLISGHSDLAIGSRLARGSQVVRGPKREFISRCYNLLLRGTLQVSFSDAQCGFKAIRREVAEAMLPLCEDNNWFFDTELLVLAQRAGLRIHEVPVDWVDDPDSRVNLVATAMEDLRGIARIGLGLARGTIPLAPVADRVERERVRRVVGVPAGLASQVVRFAGIGVLSTLAYMALFWILRGWWPAQAANLVALVVTAVLNTAANRRLTFGIRGRRGLLTDHAGGLAAFAIGLGLTSGSLALLQLSHGNPPPWLELVVLTVANAAATLVRFLVLRGLMHHRNHRSA